MKTMITVTEFLSDIDFDDMVEIAEFGPDTPNEETDEEAAWREAVKVEARRRLITRNCSQECENLATRAVEYTVGWWLYCDACMPPCSCPVDPHAGYVREFRI